MVGGGARNELLCRWTAEAAGLPVVAGPEEATLVGNLLVQAMALGELASLEEARDVVRASFVPVTYEPSFAPAWVEARDRFAELLTTRAASGGGLVTETAAVLHGIPAPEDHWDDLAAAGLNVLEGLAYRSNLLGADRALANVGGGNTSAKETTTDHTGREVRVLWVKGSGTDLATITTEGFAGLRLDELLPLRELAEMDDATMVEYLLRCGLRPGQPRPSIETLLHAFVPAPHVDHTHPDAVIALTSTPRGRELAQEAFGPEAVWLDYQRPGFDMSRRIALLLEDNPEARAVLLERHGLVTWGATGDASYRATLEFVARAAEAIEAAGRRPLRPRRSQGRGAAGRGPSTPPSSRGALPALRGALLADADGLVLEVDTSPAAVAFASSVRGPEVSQVGAPCPDHLISTKHKPLVVRVRSGSRTALPSCARGSGPASTSTPPGIDATTSETSTTRPVGSRSIPPDLASCSSRASAS